MVIQNQFARALDEACSVDPESGNLKFPFWALKTPIFFISI